MSILDYVSTARGSGSLDNRVIVRRASDLSGVILSTLEYFIDGVIDMGTDSIEVPIGGINLTGYNFDVSKLISSEDNYTMFTSPVGGSGNVIGKDFAIEVTGASSQVYDLTSSAGLDAIEFIRVNYNDCTSLGTLDSYRQGLETGSGRFGGKPELTLVGSWVGGYLISSSIVRSLIDGSYTLFKAGAGFSMNSRFKVDMNVDLPANASLTDFAPANFTKSSILQLQDMLVTRDGVFDPTDVNLTPNTSSSELTSAWRNNIGLPNTFEGGINLLTTEIETIVTLQSTYYTLAGTWTASDLQHFDNPANGQLRHLGDSPREYKMSLDVVLRGKAGDNVSLRLRVWDDSASAFISYLEQTREINPLPGGRNVGFFTIIGNVILDKNDYVFLEVLNNTGTDSIFSETGAFFIAEAR